MSCRYPIMTRADRQNRREKIIAAFKRGECQYEIAKRYGMTVDWARRLARRAGVVRDLGRGRRRIWRDCPPDLLPDYDMMVRKARIPAAEAMEMLKARAVA